MPLATLGLQAIGEGAVREGRGTILPYLIGPQRALGYCVCGGASAVLREAFNPATQTVFKVSRREDLEEFSRGAVNAFVNGAQYAWPAGSIDLVALEIRNVTQTVAGFQEPLPDVGDVVWEMRERVTYAFGSVPVVAGAACSVASSANLLVNGLVKPATTPPTHTVDLAAVDGLTDGLVVLVTFDLSTVDSFTSPYVDPGSLAAYQRWAGYIAAYVAYLNEQAQQLLYQPYTGQATVAPVPGPPNPNPVPVNPRQRLGLVELEVSGLRDTATGAITGTANKLFAEPVDCLRLWLHTVYGQTLASLQGASWTATQAAQALAGIRWGGFPFFGPDFPTVQREVGVEGGAVLFKSGSAWKYVWEQRNPVSFTLDASRLLAPLAVRSTPARDIVSALTVRYGYGPLAEQTLRLTSARGERVVGLNQYPESGDLRLPWITNPTSAEFLGRRQLRQRDHRRLLCDPATTWETVAVERADAVLVDADVLTPYGVGTMPWLVRGERDSPDLLRTFALVTDEFPPLELRRAFAVAQSEAASFRRAFEIGLPQTNDITIVQAPSPHPVAWPAQGGRFGAAR